MTAEQQKGQNHRHRRTPDGQGKKPPLPAYRRGPFNWLLIALAVMTVMTMVHLLHRDEELQYSAFLKRLDAGEVKSVEIRENKIIGKFNTGEQFKVTFNSKITGEDLVARLEKNNVAYEFAEVDMWFLLIMQWIMPVLLFVVLF